MTSDPGASGMWECGHEVTPRRLARLERVGGPCDESLRVDASHPSGPVFIGDGPLSYVCPACFSVLCEGVAPGDLAGVAVRCWCGAVGRVPRGR